MAASSLSAPSLFLLSPSNRSPIPKSPNSSLVSSPKPRTRRKNHLRPKIPTKPQPPEPIVIETPHIPFLIQEEAEDVESVQESTHESQTLDPIPIPNPNPNHRLFLLDLSLRFAALLAVQTVAAVWVLGGRGGGLKHEEESSFSTGVRVFEEQVDESKQGKELSDFERVVLEIRKMAKEAREIEAKEMEENEFEREGFGFVRGVLDEKEGLMRDSGRGKLGSQKRLGFVRSNVSRRMNAGKGFNGTKKTEEDSNAGDSGKGIPCPFRR